MRSKLIFIAGIGVGYVVGSKRGRQAYDRMVARARELWGSPMVHDGIAKGTDALRDRVPGGGRIAEVVERAADKLDDAAGSSNGNDNDNEAAHRAGGDDSDDAVAERPSDG